MMTNLLTLLLILTPLFVGFLLPAYPSIQRLADKGLTWLVFVILTIIGIELAQIPMLGSQVVSILKYVVTLAVCTIGAGLLALIVFDHLRPWTTSLVRTAPKPISIHGSLLQLGCVVVGFGLGKLLPSVWLPPSWSITALLMLLILFVGIALRATGIGLRQVMLNRRGLQVSGLFMLSVLAGGVIFAAMFSEVSVWQGLALASGFGWYSLSAVVMTEHYGAVWGSVALFNDLLREFVALAFIPLVMRRHPSAAVGLGGATSLDFTLPIIQQSGGMAVVPLAMSFGFIINIASPILMMVFASID